MVWCEIKDRLMYTHGKQRGLGSNSEIQRNFSETKNKFLKIQKVSQVIYETARRCIYRDFGRRSHAKRDGSVARARKFKNVR
ncbi:unnamed protein product [Nesidiocoris tenuis]|uniref:Uncharacterized protein n=1 Tax=Nesidiocoris tenuis TaxID=355587 RepID=A0A6H5G5E4_9HEMI|nr:unnamed protein product [Nesidiocoris tenuis]